jgi:5-methylcytosine-specific restriction enzyme subunit McrC
MMAMPAQPREAPGRLIVELNEWTSASPASDARLRGVQLGDAHAVKVAADLARRVDIHETSAGLEITARSHVGSVDVGPVRVIVRPKLPQAPLTRLLAYAYGLRDLSILEETQTPTSGRGIHDLLAAMLGTEADALLRQGLAKRHVQRAEKLESPRGRIAIREIARQGGVIEARLPCRYFDRRLDWHLNQIVRAGLDMAAANCDDRELRHRLHRLASAFPEAPPQILADKNRVAKAQREITRLTTTYEPALALIALLQDMQGVELEAPSGTVRIPGYLFDMNAFFQRLVSRFLHENLAGTARIEDERSVRNIFVHVPGGNPKSRAAPHVRPDYALFDGKSPRAFLDAKYRDVWSKGYPNYWLYQLAIYALPLPKRVSVMLYATMSAEAIDEVIELRSPIASHYNESATIILRPVILERLAELLEPANRHRLVPERRQLAASLTSLERTRSL